MGSLPIAGLTAHYLQYVLGLRALGYDVLYVEDTGWYWDPASQTYVDEWNGATVPARAHPARRLERLFRHYGLESHWTWVDIDGSHYGVVGDEFTHALRRAELLIHVTGAGRLRDHYLAIPHRAYIDTDPGYVQMRTARYQHEADLELLHSHTAHFSYAGNIGTPECSIPAVGQEWHPTRQPIYLPLWAPCVAPPRDAPFTTIVKWAPYDPVEFEGVVYGMKDVEFMRFVDLPSRTRDRFLLAMEGPPPITADELRARRWLIEDGLPVSKSLQTYRRFISRSRAEWSIAKHGYVATNSGWFSDRSASYMAMGRPVIVQSTGFETWLPTGEGVVSFSTLSEAVRAVESVQTNYEMHSRRARELAHAFFGSNAVLRELIEASTATSSNRREVVHRGSAPTTAA